MTNTKRTLRFWSVAVLSIVLAVVSSPASPAWASKNAKKPHIVSVRATPRSVPAGGGVVHLLVLEKFATNCHLATAPRLPSTPRTLRCAAGRIDPWVRVPKNTALHPRAVRFRVFAMGPGGKSPVRVALVLQAAAKRAVATTTTTLPTTTTAAAPSTVCTGPCKFTFPGPSFSGWASVALNAVTQNVPCPDPSFGCDATSGQTITDANVTMCAGPVGVSDAGLATTDFSLALSDGTQASQDSVTDDSSVPTAFGNYGAVAPGQCVTGDIYFDTASGSQWTSLNFSYNSADLSTSAVYVWNA